MQLLLLLLTTWCGTAVALDTAFAHVPQHTFTSPWLVPYQSPSSPGNCPHDTTCSFFGQAVAISENFAVIGDGHDDSERVHIYKKSQGGPTVGSWSHFQEIESDGKFPGTGPYSSTPAKGFGSTVQITDNFLLVGAKESARAFLFERKGAISQGFQFELVQQFQPTQLDSKLMKRLSLPR